MCECSRVSLSGAGDTMKAPCIVCTSRWRAFPHTKRAKHFSSNNVCRTSQTLTLAQLSQSTHFDDYAEVLLKLAWSIIKERQAAVRVEGEAGCQYVQYI